MSILRRTVRGTAWTFASVQVATVLSFVSSIVIARVVSPGDLGRYALASTIVMPLAAVSSLQSGGYYIVAAEHDPRLLQTGFALEMGLSSIALVLLGAGAGIYGVFSQDWPLVALIVFSGAGLLLNPFADLAAWYQRDLRLAIPTLLQVGGLLLATGLKVGLAVAGFGAWGLVAGDVGGGIGLAIAMVIAVPVGRRLAFDRGLARQQLAFGVPSLGAGFLNTLTQRTPDYAVALLLGTNALGFYYLASRIPAQVYQLGRSLSSALLPAFSRADDSQLARGFALALRWSAFLMALPLAVAAPLGDAFVTHVYGERWRPAGTVLVLLLAALSVRFVFWHVGNLLKSRGRVAAMAVLNAAQAALMAVACVIGAEVGGLNGVGVAVLVVEIVLVVPRLKLIRSVIPFRPAATFAGPALALVLGVGLSVACAALLPQAPALVAAAVLVTAVFAVALWRSDAENLYVVLAAFRRRAHGV